MKLTEAQVQEMQRISDFLAAQGLSPCVIVAVEDGVMETPGITDQPGAPDVCMVQVKVMGLPSFAADYIAGKARGWVAEALVHLGLSDGSTASVAETNSEGECMCAGCQSDRALKKMLGARP